MIRGKFKALHHKLQNHFWKMINVNNFVREDQDISIFWFFSCGLFIDSAFGIVVLIPFYTIQQIFNFHKVDPSLPTTFVNIVFFIYLISACIFVDSSSELKVFLKKKHLVEVICFTIIMMGLSALTSFIFEKYEVHEDGWSIEFNLAMVIIYVFILFPIYCVYDSYFIVDFRNKIWKNMMNKK